jgi:guanylate kinase
LGEYDIAYVINNFKYGIKTQPIRDLLDKGFNAFIIVSDFRVIRELKRLFGTQVQTLYVSSAIDADRLRRVQLERHGFRPSDEQKRVLAYHFCKTSAAARLGWWDRVSTCMTDLEADWHAYASDARSTEIRAEKIRAIHIRYIEHVPMFDHVILNYSENRPEEMAVQVRNLIRTNDEYEPFKTKRCPAIFVVAAASGAGKGTLMEMLHFIGRDKVRITSKLAQRAAKQEDKRDGMIALMRDVNSSSPQWPDWWTAGMRASGDRGEFPEEYDLRWEFHKFHGVDRGGTRYAVSSAEIQRNVDEGAPQIFVSNMEQFNTFRRRWPNNAVFVYLHRLVSSHDNREFHMRKWKSDPAIAEARLAEKERVYDAYIRCIAEFDHVLLNTSYQEDLYDQMFGILGAYGR